jgi:hypothetical protein
MSYVADGAYDVYRETWRRARQPHRCGACRETISPGHSYVVVNTVYDHSAETIKRCVRCQTIHEHLRTLGGHDEWPDERLACDNGEYEEHWGVAPPPEIAALAFATAEELQTMRPILFLDIDGVLNSAQTLRESGHHGGQDKRSLDRGMCERLHRVIVATNCDVVLSSAWRIGMRLSELRSWLEECGCPGVRLVGRTPYRSELTNEQVALQRGGEIQAWLDQRRGGSTKGVAIVDDSDDMWHLKPRLVQTTWERGLEDEHVEKLIALLMEDEG